MQTHMNPADRKKQILEVAVTLSKKQGYQHVTREDIARGAECATGLINRYFGTMPQLRRAVMRWAVKHGELAIVAQGIVAKDPQALKAPDDLKQRALASLTK
jgi:AcrR family transcriptional regulator